MYTAIRSYYRYGNEDDYIDCTFKEFEKLEKAIAYAHRYSTGIRFVSCAIECENGNLVYELLSNGIITDYTNSRN